MFDVTGAEEEVEEDGGVKGDAVDSVGRDMD